MPLTYDIKLATMQTFYDLQMVLGIQNKLVAADIRERFSPLSDGESFATAFRQYRSAFGLIARVRSIWDKLFMYVGISVHGIDFLHETRNAKSKRRHFFRRFAAGIGSLSKEDVEKIRSSLDELENAFRTPELHGFGSLRQWAFSRRGDWDQHEIFAITGHWQTMHHYQSVIFGDVSTNQNSFDM
jgi:DNA phosphorothioation-dependent restriction protein DptG